MGVGVEDLGMVEGTDSEDVRVEGWVEVVKDWVAREGRVVVV